MIFGQETNDWGTFPHQNGIYHLLKTYDEFYNDGNCYSYGGQFWNGVSQLKKALSKKLNVSEQEISIIWNNLIKIGKAGEKGAPSNEIIKWQDNWFDIVLHEVVELRPDAIVFFTGPYYDKFILRIFSDVSFKSVDGRNIRELALVQSSKLPKTSIRTYHPNYLWRNGFYEYLEDMINAII